MDRKEAWDAAEAELETWNSRSPNGRVGTIKLFDMQLRLAAFLHDPANNERPIQ
jgi:hypothetical protein